MIWKPSDPFEQNNNCDLDLPDYIHCVTTHLQEISTAIIDFSDDWKLTKEIAFKSKPQDGDLTGHQLPCKGDSGAGHWVQYQGQENEVKKAVLVGVTATAGLCGLNSYMHRITDPAIMKFIKENS